MKILITGAASGIGYLTALTLSERGHFVYLTTHTKKEEERLKEELKDIKNIEVMKIDITDELDRKKVLSLNIDCLFNNAAMGLGGSIIEADMNKVRENFEVNVFSSFELLQIILKQMIDKDSGRIIVMSSLASMFTFPFMGIYSSTKASISTITKSLQKELFFIGTNAKVVLIEPGLYHTGFNQVFLDNKYDDGKYFSDIKEELNNIEHFLVRLGEKEKLDSIVIEIVKAIEEENPKDVYRAPFIHSKLAKIYSIFR